MACQCLMLSVSLWLWCYCYQLTWEEAGSPAVAGRPFYISLSSTPSSIYCWVGCVCVVLLPLKDKPLQGSADIIYSKLCHEDVTQGCMASAVSPEQLKPHLFFLVGQPHSHSPSIMCFSSVHDNIMSVCMTYLIFSDQRHSKKGQK